MKVVKAREICGETYVTKPPVLSENGEYVFVSWRNSVYSYFVKTGKRINEYKGIKNVLISLDYICKHGTEYVVATSKNSNIYIWDVPTTALLERHELVLKGVIDFRLVDLMLHDGKIEFKGIVVVCKDTNIISFLYNSITKQSKRLHIQLKDNPFRLALGGSEDRFAVVASKNMWQFARFSDPLQKSRGLLPEGVEITAVACHPTEECILIGDSLGRVTLCYSLLERFPTRSKFHWHSLPVRALWFSPSGTSFYSGGDEAVLVKWDINDHHNKDFLPRLPAAIKYVTTSANNSILSISTTDNAIRLLDPQFKTISIIQQFVANAGPKAGIVFDERSKSLVFNSLNGHIQFFRPHDSTLMYSLDIVGQNKVTGERELEVETAEIRAIAFSKCGTWLATVEQRIGTWVDREIKLKFWNFNETNQRFHLNTCIDFPHDESVTKVLFQSTNKEDGLKCVTISEDKKFKVWENAKYETIHRKGFSWRCVGAAYYKDQIPFDVSFSSDSSLIAVAFGAILTTWLPDTCQLKCSLIHPDHHHRNLCSIAFGTGNHCHLIVTATKREVSVWNLLTVSMIWTAGVDAAFIVADPFSAHMVVFTRTNKFIVFTPDNSKPIYTSAKLLKNKFIPIAGVFVRNANSSETSKWYERSQLYIINDQSTIHCVAAKKSIQQEDVMETNKMGNILQFLKPVQKSVAAKITKPTVHSEDDLGTKQKILRDFLDLPVHTMPPVRLLCKSILQALIEENNNKVT